MCVLKPFAIFWPPKWFRWHLMRAWLQNLALNGRDHPCAAHCPWCSIPSVKISLQLGSAVRSVRNFLLNLGLQPCHLVVVLHSIRHWETSQGVRQCLVVEVGTACLVASSSDNRWGSWSSPKLMVPYALGNAILSLVALNLPGIAYVHFSASLSRHSWHFSRKWARLEMHYQFIT